MHTYYNPPLELREIGRPLHGDTFTALQDALGDGEVLFELMQRPDHVYYAVLMDSQQTFDQFRHLSETHPYTRLGYYAVPWSDAEEGADEKVEDWMKV
jgi:hypothetical protein